MICVKRGYAALKYGIRAKMKRIQQKHCKKQNKRVL